MGEQAKGSDNEQRSEAEAAHAIGEPRHFDEPSDDMTPFEAATFFFQQSAQRIGLEDEKRRVLGTSYRELAVQVPVKMDDGRMEVYRGYRIQHNGSQPPG